MLGDGVPAPGEDTSAPVDDSPAVVVDDLSSSRRLLAYCCGLSGRCPRWRSVSSTISVSGAQSWICAHWHSVSATVESSGVLLPPLSVHPFLAAGVCPSCLDTPVCWGIVIVVSLVPSRARSNTSYENRPLSSGRWCGGSEVLLSYCRWEFPVSSKVLSPQFDTLTEENRLRPIPGTIMAEIRTGTSCPAWSMMYPQIVPVVVANTVALP